MAGDYFDMSVMRRQIPPAGPAFINRFLHGDPTEWSDEWTEARRQISAAGDLDASVAKLTAMFERIAAGGAPLPVIQAAENAITITLTAVCVDQARQLITSRPSLAGMLWKRGDESMMGWDSNGAVDNLAFIIREECGAVDIGLFQNTEVADRPGRCFKVAVHAIETAGRQLRELDPAIVASLLHPAPPGSVAFGDTALRRMKLAADSSKLAGS